MRGRSPKAVDAGPKPERGAEAQCSRCRAEARCSRGKSPKVGLKPDAVNAGPKPDAGQKPKSWAETRCNKCWAEARCSRCMLDKKVQEMQKQWSMLSNSARRCKAVTLIFSHSLRREGGNLVLKSQ
ncbi:hypothetical protein CRG98_039577 [Punica granatum]|uniref:Uncharacterized protein n=1 Tax=Punica granatum TaxID=22663 RepID=A0A2I0I7P7_PUNGR|nr:hypothetical protein CRG98_039577 [Punica granatum]